MRELIQAQLNKGVTQRELAGKIGFSHSTIQKILFTDTKCTYETRKLVADYFHVPVSDFYDQPAGIIPTGKPPQKESAPADAETWKNKYIACMEELIEAKREIERLKASPIGAGAPVASSGSGGT